MGATGAGGLSAPRPWTFFTETVIFTATVKNGETVNSGANVEARLRRVLEAIPGLAVQRLERPAAGRDAHGEGEPPDAIVALAGQRLPVACLYRTYVNAAVAWAFVRWAAAMRDARPLLVAGKTTVEAREIMGRHGAAYVDGAGFAHVAFPGLFVHTAGRDADRRRRPAGARATVRLAGRAGVAVQALLLDPHKDWGVHALAQVAHVSPGLAHRVLQRLEAEGVVESSGAGPAKIRRVADPTVLLDVWAEETRDLGVLRTPALRPARTPRELVWHVAHGLDAQDVTHAVTGAAAAALFAPSAAAVPVTELWVTEAVAVDDVLRTVDAEAVDSGHNLVLLQARDDLPLAFRAKTAEGLWTVNPARLYADLRADPLRGLEQADEIRREILRF